ncbi:uncharacterized protein LOC112058121 [Bicyclus anynana]|uniref:Uncharacterized protein LOC112058121 n=1 Tax=Bicyclus anynana TaxID=110368 RepID=A0A6J1P9U3_BICAN|nr:uncharacterized protein LOC112058121 [Bicyclus anynana]
MSMVTHASFKHHLINMDMDIDLFISEIKSRPAIWDTKSDSYSNRGERVKAWEEICELFVLDYSNKTAKQKNMKVNKLQRKWKSLRDSFNRENAKNKKVADGSEASSSKQYIYYNQLSFLNSLKEIPPSTDDAPGIESNINEKPRQLVNKVSKKGNDVKTENELLKQFSESMKRNYDAIYNDNNPDKQFLMSLLPHVQKIDERFKLDFQTEVLQLIKKYQINYPTHSAPYLWFSENPNENENTTTKNILSTTPTIQPSPSHSHCSDQSNNSTIEDKFHDDNAL